MDRKLIEEFDKKQKSLKNKKKNHNNDSSQSKSAPKSKHPKLTKEPEPTLQLSGQYRDRAQERREGLNRDFELDPDDLRIPGTSTELEDHEIDDNERRRQEIEESKYLGGDLEHTHLVKGLDFALLEKVKSDQKLAEKLNEGKPSNHKSYVMKDDSDSEDEDFIQQAIIAASTTASKKQLVDIEKLKKGQSTEIIPCNTLLARRILNVLDEKWPDKSDLFLPGRMSYVLAIDDDTDRCAVTTIQRSKADAIEIDDGTALDESDFALDQLINILARIRQEKRF